MPTYDDNAALFLGLSQSKGIGFKTLREMGGVDAVGAAVASRWLERTDVEPLAPKSPEELIGIGEKVIEKLRAANVNLIRLGDPTYPRRFLDLPHHDRPLWFFARGNLDLLTIASIAVVGTRSASDVGDFLTRFAVSTCAEIGIPVISGLARGIDAVAHHWCVRSHVPTISILGTGILRPYPASNTDLAAQIVANDGLLISEYLPFSEPVGEHFVMRNRLQAALANAVVAPEWLRSSGTAHTVRFAKSMQRPTMNLRLEGVEPAPKHGVADEEFLVPREHERFRKALLDAATITAEAPNSEPRIVQGSLWR